jgi:hypothetical protein
MSKSNIFKLKDQLDALFGSNQGMELLWKFIKVKQVRFFGFKSVLFV